MPRDLSVYAHRHRNTTFQDSIMWLQIRPTTILKSRLFFVQNKATAIQYRHGKLHLLPSAKLSPQRSLRGRAGQKFGVRLKANISFQIIT